MNKQQKTENFRRLMTCLTDEVDLEQARRLLSDPALQWSYDDFNTVDPDGLLPVTHAILNGDAHLVRLFYEYTNLLSRNGDGVHPYDVIEMILELLQQLRQKQRRTQQQQATYDTLVRAEQELLAMRDYVGHRWLPVLRYLRSLRPAVEIYRGETTDRPAAQQALGQAWMDVKGQAAAAQQAWMDVEGQAAATRQASMDVQGQAARTQRRQQRSIRGAMRQIDAAVAQGERIGDRLLARTAQGKEQAPRRRPDTVSAQATRLLQQYARLGLRPPNCRL